VKFLIDNLALVVLALASGGLLLWQTLQKHQGGSIGTAEAVRLINREKAVVVDVSDAAEFAAGHAKGARHIPLASLAGAKELPGNKTLPVLLMCTTGNRAGRAAGVLRKAGYERAVAVSGGVNAWREASLPIERG
jgi:rhodanese-related sulfurtransferase